MRLVIQEDATNVGEFVAAYVVKRIKDFQPSSTRPFVLGLPTGSTPLLLYKELIKCFKAGQVHCAAPHQPGAVFASFCV